MNIQQFDCIKAETDIQNEIRGLGVSKLQFKTERSSSSDMFALENIFTGRGGPAKHLHLYQDEWFYCLEGKFAFEIGGDKIILLPGDYIRFTDGSGLPGDSIIGPKQIPHVWAHVGDSSGRILVVFAPAGKMEDFFREVTQANAMPAQQTELWRKYDMELLGPPMNI